MAILLQFRTTTKSNTFTNPSLLHRLFSSSNFGDDGDQPPPNSNSPFSSYFRNVKDSLKQQQPSTPSPPRSSPTFSFTASSKQTSLEEIRRNLSEFRRRTSVPPPDDPSSSQQISFQELYQRRNVLQKPDQSTGDADSGPAKPHGKFSLDAIRDSLRQIGAAQGGADRRGADRMSLPAFKDSLKLRHSDSASSTVIGGTSALPESVFGREMRKKKEEDGSSAAMETMFVKMYGYAELGEKLRKLRPQEKGKEWFSLGELNERLMRLREMEERESVSTIKGGFFKDVRESLMRLQVSDDEKAKKTSLQRLDILGQLGGTPTYLLEPPKEHLVEKYFHPDNMSSAEKLKIELAKVRDEFKMSESDCGSARVQVAQLTTKIKHLSSVLHKKDVHSRKGLLAMVQRRKRLLKYLRRTDWDSFCFVISKLGLRDNPDHSNKIRTGRSRQAASS